MTFTEYQKEALKTKLYPDFPISILYLALGVNGESGELGERVKKVFRDNEGKFDQQSINAISKEVGDVLWYLSALCYELHLNLEDVAKSNLIKLQDRINRGVIKGDGDNR